jgi:hypothetical protein
MAIVLKFLVGKQCQETLKMVTGFVFSRGKNIGYSQKVQRKTFTKNIKCLNSRETYHIDNKLNTRVTINIYLRELQQSHKTQKLIFMRKSQKHKYLERFFSPFLINNFQTFWLYIYCQNNKIWRVTCTKEVYIYQIYAGNI